MNRERNDNWGVRRSGNLEFRIRKLGEAGVPKRDSKAFSLLTSNS
jgi:hypothetical protein